MGTGCGNMRVRKQKVRSCSYLRATCGSAAQPPPSLSPLSTVLVPPLFWASQTRPTSTLLHYESCVCYRSCYWSSSTPSVRADSSYTPHRSPRSFCEERSFNDVPPSRLMPESFSYLKSRHRRDWLCRQLMHFFRSPCIILPVLVVPPHINMQQ